MDSPSQPQVTHDQAHGDSTSPIMNLNADVVREIFLFCLFGKSARIPPKRSEPRLVLSHVCSSWRVLALHTPELWSCINVDGLGRPQRYECLNTWLHRSAQSLLSIHGSMYDPEEGGKLDHIILSNIHRCQQLTMDVALTIFSKLLSIPPGSLGALVDVNICFLVSRFGEELRSLAINTPITAFQMAPRLRCVTLSSMYHDESAVDLQCLRLPWPQLTTLKLYDMELAPDCCIAILRACVALESCSISVAFISNIAINEIHARAEPAVILPALHTLYLSGDILHAPFLAAFHLPSLRFLELSDDHIERWSVGILTPILTPTAHTLQVLSIGETTPYISFNGDTPDQDVHALLELLPHLTVCLVKTAVCWKRSALNAIRDGKCGVRLETLRIGELYTEELLDFAEGRLRAARESAGAISMVTVLHGMYEPPLWNDSGTARVQALYKAGVTIYFDLNSTYDIEFSSSDSLSDETSESEGSD